jgi:hypothetical protein
MRPARSPRRFNLTDVAILVLATAVGLSGIRSHFGLLLDVEMEQENGQWVAWWRSPIALLYKVIVLEPVLMAWSVGWLVLQLRRPRPRMRRLTRQPGFAACFASAFVLFVTGPITAAVITHAVIASCARTGESFSDQYWLVFETWSALVSCQIGAAVAAGWALLALGRQCHIKSGWLDRVGQAIGLIWVVTIPANLYLMFWVL